MKLLFITERINEADDDLAFVIDWIEEFRRQGWQVEVICLKKGVYTRSFPVHSLGKEDGSGKLAQLVRFYKLIMGLEYDRVFVHLSPFWLALGSFWWVMTGKPTYLWYTHYKMTFSLRVAALVAKRMFAATPQSLPQYEGNPKKTIVNHGVDPNYWLPDSGQLEEAGDHHRLVSIHRISRSKRIELTLGALTLLPPQYTLTIYGRPLDQAYFEELQTLIKEKGLEKRVEFKGPVPMPQLRIVYPSYRLMVNMAYETIDKTMLEGMLYGVFPVTTPANARAIGLELAPKDDTSESIAAFILAETWKNISRHELRRLVTGRHSLAALVTRMSSYIEKGA